MKHPCVTRPILLDFITQLDAEFAHPGRLYLIGETTQLLEGWRTWTTQIEFTAEVDPQHQLDFSRIVSDLGERRNVAVVDESPADLIPLPDGHQARHRPIRVYGGDGNLSHLSLHHFDPYSVAFRFIARGDEPDYHIVLTFLHEGWITVGEMDSQLEALLPLFTAKTIQQDPAEFRRKYEGLQQMWRSVQPRSTHRSTVV